MIDRIQNISRNNITNAKHNNKEQSFKGVGTLALRTLNNSPAVGACAVDLCSMVIPRTVIEWKNRGTQSGIETAIREGTSNLIHTCVGLIGLGAATLVSVGFNKNHNVKAQNIFASGNTIDNMFGLWKKSKLNQTKFFEGFVDNLSGLDGTQWKSISSEAKPEIVQNMVSLAEKTKHLASVKGADKKSLAEEIKNIKSSIVAQVVKDTGAQASFQLKSTGGKTKALSSNFSELLDNAVSISNTFKDKSVKELPKFVESLKKNKTASTLLGMGICALLCISVQPVNRWLTKKRTGSDGFVGVENDKEDKTTPQQNSKKIQPYKIAKTVAGLAFPLAAIRTIGPYPNLISNIQFNSKVPTINQFKFLYGGTIGSRFLSARDGNELREATIKDTLGFTNWLILGGMVSKLTARALGGKELINNPVKQVGKKGLKYAGKWLTQASVKSFDEVLMPKAKEITKDGKIMKFSEILKKADPETRKKIRTIGIAQVAGYLYSGLVLGVGIAKLNIFITKQVNARRKAKEQMNNKVNAPIVQKRKQITSPVFKEFN